MKVDLTFYNRSNDGNNSQVVLLQKNACLSLDYNTVAWKVITNCSTGSSHRFNYPFANQVSASDSWGNETRKLTAFPGERFAMEMIPSGSQLIPKGDASSSDEIQLINNLHCGAISANIYKDNRLIARHSTISPEQMASFRLEHYLYCGTASQIEEGAILDSAIITQINTQISLIGVASADLIMIGGGNDIMAKPFNFYLENVVRF